MSLEAGCPRCPATTTTQTTTAGPGWRCPVHGPVEPLWRPRAATYDTFAEHLTRCGDFPTYLPWPLGPGWTVSDFAAVGDGRALGTVTCCSGTSALDGVVDVLVVTEEPGVGLGARVAGTPALEPDTRVWDGPPTVKVRAEGRSVPLWPVSTALTIGLTGATGLTGPGEGDPDGWDRSVLVGEADGRWLWLVMRPASAVLLLRDEWILRDASRAGPQLVAVPFGGPTPGW